MADDNKLPQVDTTHLEDDKAKAISNGDAALRIFDISVSDEAVAQVNMNKMVLKIDLHLIPIVSVSTNIHKLDDANDFNQDVFCNDSFLI